MYLNKKISFNFRHALLRLRRSFLSFALCRTVLNALVYGIAIKIFEYNGTVITNLMNILELFDDFGCETDIQVI